MSASHYVIQPEHCARFDRRVWGRVHRLVGRDGTAMTIAFGDEEACVDEAWLFEVPAPAYDADAAVFVLAKAADARVRWIGWHHARNEHIYHLAFDGKRSSRRYYADELRAPASARA